jgi:hypothetical protein
MVSSLRSTERANKMAKSKFFGATESPKVESPEVEVEKLPEASVPEQAAPAPESPESPETVVEGNLVRVPETAVQTAQPVMYDEEKLKTFQNLSQKIRYLNSIGATNSQIVKILKYNAKGGNLIYQHVRNVLKQSRKTA